ncbi:IS3 family transposase, partial [Arthrospira platensis SPKY1]|nr:IS3 family transposase [Arthrospira platensis SPKY1]
AIINKMNGPERKTIRALAREEGISEATLYGWRKEARCGGRLLPNHDDTPEGWSSQDKFNAVLETAALNEVQLSEYCRRHGLYPEQIARWREACSRANDYAASERAYRERTHKQDKVRLRK